MAQVPYSPVPTNVPSTASPADAMNIQASPQDFGAQVGAAAQRLGGTLQQAGAETVGTAGQYQQRANNIAVDKGYYAYMDQVNAKLAGDPNTPGDQGYFGLHGQAAVDARPALDQSLEDLRQTMKAGLGNQAQQLEFDQQTKRLSSYTAQRIDAKYEQEFNNAALFSSKANSAIAERSVAIDYNNDSHFNAVLTDQLGQADAQSVHEGAMPGTPEGDQHFAYNRMERSQALYLSRATAMGTANPSQGLAFVQANKDQFDAITLRRLTDEFKVGADAATVATGIGNAMTPGGVTPTNATVDQLDRAIHGQESGGAANSQTSVDGAVGGHQIIPATFAQYARPGESISNPADNAAVGKRIIADLSQKFDGDPARVAVGYFSGPGNVSPPGSPTPWIRDATDGNGKSTSSYVTDVQRRLAGGQGAGAPATSGAPPIPQSGARDQAISPRYMDEINMIQRAYAQTEPMMQTNPKVALQIRTGVMEQIARENAFENGAQDRASRDMSNHQRDNEAVLFGTAVAGQPIAESDLASYLKTQQITPSGYTAIKAVQQRQAEGQDEPKTVAALWDGIGNRSVTAQDVFGGITTGLVKGTTGNEMIRALSAQAKTQTNAVEKGDYETLKTALGGHALESGQMDIFGEGKAAQAQLWNQAQGEWNKRVVSGSEKPDDVLADMMPRYQKSIPDRPAAWPNPRFGMVGSTQDVGAVAAKTKAALDSGQINQDTYQSEGALLSRYLTYYQMQDARAAAAGKVPKGTSRPTTLTPGSP